MKLAIVGTRGIPNRYGGFEECAEQLSLRWVAQGHQVRVYGVHHHPYSEPHYHGVERVSIFDPQRWGSASQFVYDLGCILHLKKNPVDAVLQLGYTSSGIWQRLWPHHFYVATNPDGLEWTRAKYSEPVKRFLKWSEGQAVRRSNALIADAPEIARQLKKEWGVESHCIPYGTERGRAFVGDWVEDLGLEQARFDLILARMEPENQIESMLRARLESESQLPLIVVGGTENSYARRLIGRYACREIRFVGSCYDRPKVEGLRRAARYYLHGHTAGGTNPSLLEAMASGCAVIAHSNPFNRWVLGEQGEYFSNITELAALLSRTEPVPDRRAALNERLERDFDWDSIADRYLEVLKSARPKT